jgi:superfamily II DNA or RNA helicase
MSSKVLVSDTDEDQREQIHEDLTIKLEDNKYARGAPPRYVYAYSLKDEHLSLPFAYAYRTLKLSRPKRDQFPQMNKKFEGTLREEQEVVRIEAIKHLEKTGSTVISCFCGFGKTIGAINIACTIKFKTLIIVHKIILMKQWEESINTFCPSAVVQKLTPGSVMKCADFYIINAINAVKRSSADYTSIGTVIVDETHLIMAETLSKSLEQVHPRYLIALSATPYRADGLNKLIELYFGLNKIVRKLNRPHTVYKVSTGFIPEFELSVTGKVNWNTILDSQAFNHERNEMIMDIITCHPDRTFLVLVKRVAQGLYLTEELKKRGETVSSLLGKTQTFDPESRILVGTNSKIGTGFDHPKLDALLLAADVESYFIQYLGRPMRTKLVVPLIFDLVDKNSILEKHYGTRRAEYLECGGTIKNYISK